MDNSEPVDFADTAPLAEMFGETGEWVTRGTEAIEAGRAVGASDPMLWAIIIGSVTVMTLGALRQVLFKISNMVEASHNEKLEERRIDRDQQNELFMKRHGLKHYATMPAAMREDMPDTE